MKVSLVLVFLVVGQAIAAPSYIFSVEKMSFNPPIHSRVSQPQIDLCSLCVQFSGQFINALLNIVLNAGVVGGCADLCELLAEKTGNKLAGEVCDVLCDVVGIKEFVDIIEKADLDPIYYCELLKACKVKDDGDAKITSLTVTPSSVAYGSDFTIELQFTTMNGTGTGEIDVVIHAADGLPLAQNQLVPPMDPGSYDVKWQAKAAPDPDCDPTQGPCEMWIPGNYTVEAAVCNGECGSKHPHSQVYDTAKSAFTVVRN